MVKKGDWSEISTKVIYASMLFVLVWAFLVALNNRVEPSPAPGLTKTEMAPQDVINQCELLGYTAARKNLDACPLRADIAVREIITERAKPKVVEEKGMVAVYNICTLQIRTSIKTERKYEDKTLTIYGEGTRFLIGTSSGEYEVVILNKGPDKIEIGSDCRIRGTHFRIGNVEFRGRGMFNVVPSTVELSSVGFRLMVGDGITGGYGVDIITPDLTVSESKGRTLFIGKEGFDMGGRAPIDKEDYLVLGDSNGFLRIGGEEISVLLKSDKWAALKSDSDLQFNLKKASIAMRNGDVIVDIKSSDAKKAEVVELNGNMVKIYKNDLVTNLLRLVKSYERNTDSPPVALSYPQIS